MKPLFLIVVLIGILLESHAAGPAPVLTSPDGKIVYQFRIQKGVAVYSVIYRGTTVIDFSPLQLFFENDSLSAGVRILRSVTVDSVEQYSLPTGRSSSVRDSFRRLTITLQSVQQRKRQLELEVRAFNDGVAFRYHFISGTDDSLTLRRESTAFRVTGNPQVHALVLPNYNSSHEGTYHHGSLQELPADSLMDMPMLFSWPEKKLYLAITEAALIDYAGMYLVKENGGLQSILSPRPDMKDIAVKAGYPHVSPWRVIMLSDRAGRFLETNLLTDLAPPQKFSDISWIKPGTSTFPWWNGNVTTDTLNAPGNNFVTQQYYIDFCARNHIAYHSVVEYGLHQWYQDDGVNFQPGPHPDVTKPVPGLDMKEVCDYAHSKGVGVRIWVQFYALYPKLDSAFALYEQWGLSGMMVDFMDRDDQLMVNMQNEVLEKAAAHHLHIQFHGAYKPTGLARTYPNEFTREGTRNYEVNKWTPGGLSPDHDLDIAYTRGLAGSTDYHLGGFRAVTPDKFRAQYTRPLQLGTRCHMLAMYVVLENAVSMVCDYPEAYEGQPGFEFLQTVPTTWDETRVLSGEPDKNLVIARRKGKDWYVTGISNRKAVDFAVSLSFLGTGTFEATIFQDVVESPLDPNAVKKSVMPVTAATSIRLPAAAGGGFAVRVQPRQ